MEESLKAAILIARAAQVNAEIAGMMSENQHRVANGDSIAYGYEAFEALAGTYGVDSSSITGLVVHNDIQVYK